MGWLVIALLVTVVWFQINLGVVWVSDMLLSLSACYMHVQGQGGIFLIDVDGTYKSPHCHSFSS